jgi:hypothetical protein
MALTNEEKEKVRYHLGYPATNSVPSIQMGIPKVMQALFLVDQSFGLLTTTGEERVRELIQVLDNIECRLINAQSALGVQQTGGIQVNLNQPNALEAEYRRWAFRLADFLGVPVYPLSERFASGGTHVRVMR